MTINTHLTVNEGNIESLPSNVFPPTGIGINSLGVIVNQIASLVPDTYSCDEAAGLLNSYLAAVNLGIDGTVFARPIESMFSCPSGDGSGILKAVGAFGSIGQVQVTFTGGIANLSFLDWPDTVLDPVGAPSYGLQWSNGDSSGGIITVNYPLPKVASFDTAREFVGDNIPICGIGPLTSLPSLGASVKCANFSKIFNPLGIPLNRRK